MTEYDDTKTSQILARRAVSRLASSLKRLLSKLDSPAAPIEASPRSRLRIAIVAEMSIPACRQYRVYHKVENLERLGCSVAVVNWWHFEECREAIQLADAVIFYRVGLQPLTMRLFSETARLGIPTFFDVDDIVFDEEIFSSLHSFGLSTAEQQQHLLDGVRFYRAALAVCDHAIASTEVLARYMREINHGRCLVVENGFDAHMLRLSQWLLNHPLPRSPDKVVIGYGSGTATHDSDFAKAVPALTYLLETHPSVELAIQGPLQLPPEFAAFADRIVRLPLMDIDDYLRSIASWDISIACLEDTILNRAKSPIKFIEAAALKVPSVCSALNPYIGVIDHGKNGFLASSTEDWIRDLSALVQSKALRNEIGQRASLSVHERFHPDRIADVEVKPILELIPRSLESKLRIMVVNDRPPDATRDVPAQFASRFANGDDYEVIFFHALQNAELPPHALHVSRENDLTLVGITRNDLPPDQYWNDDIARKFHEVLDICRPDLVCVFDVQRLGFSIMPACSAKRVPYLVSLHTDWWLCEPTLNGTADPCLPFANDLRHRAARADNPGLSYHRYFELRENLLNASLLLAPNDEQRELYLSHGIPETRIVLLMTKDHPAEDATHLSFDNIIRRAAGRSAEVMVS